jgi:hypothetical protein
MCAIRSRKPASIYAQYPSAAAAHQHEPIA